MRFSLAQSFAAGELPLWDRSMAMGFPLLANFQSGVFYPPHLFLLVLPFFSALRAIFFLRSWSGRDFLGLSLVLLVQFLAGSPEIYMMSMGLLICDGVRLRKEAAC